VFDIHLFAEGGKAVENAGGQHTHGLRSRGCVSTVTIVTHRCSDDSWRGIGINDSPSTRVRTPRQKHGCCDVVRIVHKNEVEIAVENAAYRIGLRDNRVIGSNGFEPESAWSATRHSTTIRAPVSCCL
jgi:hypothetical protein